MRWTTLPMLQHGMCCGKHGACSFPRKKRNPYGCVSPIVLTSPPPSTPPSFSHPNPTSQVDSADGPRVGGWGVAVLLRREDDRHHGRVCKLTGMRCDAERFVQSNLRRQVPTTTTTTLPQQYRIMIQFLHNKGVLRTHP